MALSDSDKVKVLLELGKMEHDETKVLYQLVIGAFISFSIAILIGVFQKYIEITAAFFLLFVLFEIATIIYKELKKGMESVRLSIADDISKVVKK